MLNSNKSEQKNVTAEGDVVGRDKITHETHLHGPTIFREDQVLKRLLEEHERERKIDPEYKEFSDDLNKFFSYSLNKNKRDLETKLNDGERSYLVEIAMESKERVAKKIQKFSHYISAQGIYTYLLTNIRTAFLHEVQGKIKSQQFLNYEIDEIVSSKIVEPFLHNLNGSSLSIDKDELYGLLYFLTGNCYIEWD